MWFVGLEFSKNDGAVVNLTLTSEIEMFTYAGTLLNALIMRIIYHILSYTLEHLLSEVHRVLVHVHPLSSTSH